MTTDDPDTLRQLLSTLGLVAVCFLISCEPTDGPCFERRMFCSDSRLAKSLERTTLRVHHRSDASSFPTTTETVAYTKFVALYSSHDLTIVGDQFSDLRYTIWQDSMLQDDCHYRVPITAENDRYFLTGYPFPVSAGFVRQPVELTLIHAIHGESPDEYEVRYAYAGFMDGLGTNIKMVFVDEDDWFFEDSECCDPVPDESVRQPGFDIETLLSQDPIQPISRQFWMVFPYSDAWGDKCNTVANQSVEP